MSSIEVRKNIVITKSFAVNQPSNFSYNINIPFQPDQMIITGYSWSETGLSTTVVCSINSDLTNYDRFFNFTTMKDIFLNGGGLNKVLTNKFQPLNMVFEINKQVSGAYYFNCLNVIGEPPFLQAILDGTLSIYMTFVKYKK